MAKFRKELKSWMNPRLKSIIETTGIRKAMKEVPAKTYRRPKWDKYEEVCLFFDKTCFINHSSYIQNSHRIRSLKQLNVRIFLKKPVVRTNCRYFFVLKTIIFVKSIRKTDENYNKPLKLKN
jgi:hypothetical protein